MDGPTDADQTGTEGAAETRITSLIEWQAPTMTPADANRLAARTAVAFRMVPGLLDFRFFGDFETGRHFYLQVWTDHAALDAYAASESMFRIREIAAPFVVGRPSRELFTDYSPD
ncbi:MAG: putative quinol monooxygenase [Candidatus Limnocylindrales bacterium]